MDAEQGNHPQQGNGAERSSASLIGPDIVITGNIEAKSDLYIEGKVEGDVRCSTLILGEQGAITGSVHAERVRVVGAIEGSVETNDLAVEATGRLNGDVSYERLRIVNGGVIEGSMKHRAAPGGGQDTAKLKLVEPVAPPAPIVTPQPVVAPARAAAGHVYID